MMLLMTYLLIIIESRSPPRRIAKLIRVRTYEPELLSHRSLSGRTPANCSCARLSLSCATIIELRLLIVCVKQFETPLPVFDRSRAIYALKFGYPICQTWIRFLPGFFLAK